MFNNIYTEQKLDNGDILLVRKNIPIKEYKCQIHANGDILLSRVNEIIINCDNISEYDFNNSFITEVSLNNEKINNTLKYYNYKVFLNYLTNENVNDNFNHNTYIDYILGHCQKNNIRLNMKIRLSNKNIVNIVL
jgi:hypothetical protein